MKKIPTIFQRAPDNPKRVTDKPHPDCAWVFDGEGLPTRKYDGTCTMLDESGRWWARREVKAGKPEPANFRPVETDENTGKTVGWEPIEQSAFAKWHRAALDYHESQSTVPTEPGTYELIGPKVNGNPEHSSEHVLVPHGAALLGDFPRMFEQIRTQVLELNAHSGVEGIVWHHPDGRMAKIKARDFQ